MCCIHPTEPGRPTAGFAESGKVRSGCEMGPISEDADLLSPYAAVLFDFDGTLGDSYQAITASVNHVRAAHGLPPLAEAEVRRHVGHGPAYLLGHTVPGADLARDWPL